MSMRSKMASRKRFRNEVVCRSAYCDLCRVAVSAESQWALHTAGKRHLHNLTVQKMQQEEAKCSIFVRNFPIDKTSEEDLKEAFQAFGIVKKVALRDKSTFAIVEFESAQTALGVLQHSEPVLIHGVRLTVKPRTVKEVQLTPNLTHKGEHERRDTKRVKTDLKLATRKSSFSLHKKILEVMTTAKSVDEQAECLVAGSQLTPFEVEERNQFCSKLQSVLRPSFSNCAILPFGSSVTGLAFKGADLDICLLTEILPVDTASAYSARLSAVVKEGVQSEWLEKSAVVDPLGTLQTVAQHLHRMDSGCGQVRVIADAKCPVVQFIATDVNLRCDLSVCNRLALQNTQLLKAYINSMPCILPFIFSLRCWAMAKHLVAGHHPGMLSSYTLTLMAIHYLIQKKICPCLSELPSERIEIQDWDCSFSFPSPPAKEEEEVTVEELLTGFFTYFTSEFDYEHHACRVHSSATVGKSKVCDGELPLCVQDPFEHSHILTQHVTEHACDLFISECQAALFVLRQGSKPVVSASESSVKNWGLGVLLQQSHQRTRLISLSVECLLNLLQNVQINHPHLTEGMVKLSAISNLHSLLFVICFLLTGDLACHIAPLSQEPVVSDTQLLIDMTLGEELHERKVMNRKRNCLAVQCMMNDRRWVKRRQRRVAERTEEPAVEQSESPLLKIRVYVSKYKPSDKKTVYDVHFEPVYLPYPEDFSLFFAFFKKIVLSLAKQQSDTST